MIDDATYKYMIGEITESQFDKEVEKWETSGGKQIIQEYEEAFKKQSNIEKTQNALAVLGFYMLLFAGGSCPV